MLFTMVVSLYTSRVVLEVLGVEDFGIFNIVGGIIVLFSFLNTSMTNSCQRYFSVALADINSNILQKVFSSALFFHLTITFVFILITETIGLLLLYYTINIPEHRFNTATIVYQIFIANSIVNIFRVPYNAIILANEHMDYYAYTSIAESIIRLVMLYPLVILPVDKLLLYSLFSLFVSIIMFLLYMFHCQKNFKSISFSFKYDKSILKEMSSFSGWNVFGSIADLGYTQGLNIILNLFYGVSMNAAMGIVNQARNSIFSFVSNLQVSANPQIIKSYTLSNYVYFRNLLCNISKYSYFLMIIIAIPIINNVDFLLCLWLKNPPTHTNTFLKLILVYSLIDSLHGPLWCAMNATGKIKSYQIITSLVLLLNLPCSYIALSLFDYPELIIIVQIILSVITLLVRIYYAKIQCGISFSFYYINAFSAVLKVSILAFPLSFLVYSFFSSGFIKLFIGSILYEFILFVVIYYFGINESERKSILTILNRILQKIKNKL